jgi:hypothetical protein
MTSVVRPGGTSRDERARFVERALEIQKYCARLDRRDPE